MEQWCVWFCIVLFAKNDVYAFVLENSDIYFFFHNLNNGMDLIKYILAMFKVVKTARRKAS